MDLLSRKWHLGVIVSAPGPSHLHFPQSDQSIDRKVSYANRKYRSILENYVYFISLLEWVTNSLIPAEGSSYCE